MFVVHEGVCLKWRVFEIVEAALLTAKIHSIFLSISLGLLTVVDG